ncbi:MAG: heterodisulfide reductase subunit A, partial [Hyphomicrobiales bacterium]|nr:heterodisulfide reductase subunit A [Hyphomicrobiales bacterium]
DIRAHDKLEAFYNRLRRDPQVNFVKSKPAHIVMGDDGRPVLCGERTVDREIYKEPYDLVVLATGMEPSVADGFKPDTGAVIDDYGFVVPELADDAGIFSAGVASGPLDVSMSAQSATAAALKAIQAIRAAGA